MNAETKNAETDNAAIENALTIVNLKPPAVITDGWDAAAIDMATHPMKGMASANFDNGAFFTGKEKLLIQPDKRFIAIARRLYVSKKGNAAGICHAPARRPQAVAARQFHRQGKLAVQIQQPDRAGRPVEI